MANHGPKILTFVLLLSRENNHIHIAFITVHCYNCSSLLSVVFVNLLLCLIHKLNFIIGVYVEEKGSVLPVNFRHPLVVVVLGCVFA
jgi:hypothetical protein